MKNIFKVILFFITGFMILCTSCSNDSDSSDSYSGNYSNEISGIGFDFTDAKALAAVKSSGTAQSARAISLYQDSSLVKFLEDGSIKSAINITAEGELSKIQQIYKVSATDDVFILFEGESYFYSDEGSFNLGRLICVHSDGSIVDVLKKDNSEYSDHYNLESNGEDLTFDNTGNAYFKIWDWNSSNSTTFICKFNAITDAVSKLTTAANNMSYENFVITSDGQMIIVNGSSGAGYFIRAIPISKPSFYKNIYYNSTYSNTDFYYDDDNGILMETVLTRYGKLKETV